MSDNSFRCTLTKDDLAEHHISLRDISYGSDQTRALFREMMEQAGEQLGFDAEDMPLMIEAVPLNGESIVFVITKVEDPEELDTRFAKFAPGVRDAGEEDDGDGDYESVPAKPAVKADEVLSLFHQRVTRLQKADTPDSLSREIPGLNISRVYAFSGLKLLFEAAERLAPMFTGGAKLMRSLDGRQYLLRITKEGTPIDQFNRFCNLISEYGTPLELSQTGEAYLDEHCRVLIREDALKRLAETADPEQ